MPADRVATAFEAIDEVGRPSSLRRVTGSIRIELTGRKPERWLIEIDRGNISVSRRNRKADCVARCSREQFERLLDRRDNVMAAVLRGAVEIEGDAGLLMPLRKLLVATPSAEGEGAA